MKYFLVALLVLFVGLAWGQPCTPATAATACNDGFPCTTDSCQANNQCRHVPNDGMCNDDTDCTFDQCTAEAGVSDATGCQFFPEDTTGESAICNDHYTCTVDICTASTGGTGCSHDYTDVADVCNDYSECTTDTCDGAGGDATTGCSYNALRSTGCGGDDPHFKGYHNQAFELHGHTGEVYNLISQPDFQLNAKFHHYEVKRLSNTSTWMTEFGVQFGPEYQLLINVNGSATLNGKELPLAFKQEIMPNVTVSRLDKTVVGFSTHDFSFEVAMNQDEQWCEKSEGCFHLDMWSMIFDYNDHSWKVGSGGHYLKHDHQGRDHFRTVEVMPLEGSIAQTHGILGQTVRDITYENKLPNEQYIEGTLEDYNVKSGLFGKDFKFNQFEF